MLERILTPRRVAESPTNTLLFPVSLAAHTSNLCLKYVKHAILVWFIVELLWVHIFATRVPAYQYPADNRLLGVACRVGQGFKWVSG